MVHRTLQMVVMAAAVIILPGAVRRALDDGHHAPSIYIYIWKIVGYHG
jgi:hypothetical protein